MDQGSNDWFKARAGKVTASRIADVIATVKSGESASRANYRAQLVAERLTGQPSETFSNSAMQWGTDNEPLARTAYEILRGEMVDQVGFIDHPSISNSGASPDGLIGDDGLIEIKCPNTATHIGYIIDAVPPKKYIPQMAWQAACTGRKWIDFASFDPRMPPDMQLFVVRYVPEFEYLKMLETEVAKFNEEIEQTIQKLRLSFA